MKLRSCLTLFDLVSPDEIFADFLENYFNKERCQKTLQIVSSELSYYKGDDAFRRNGIQSEVPRAFLEGIDGSDKLTYNNCIGTLLDLLGRGETMRMLISRHLWDKEDFSIYRVSNVKFRIQSYMGTIFQEIADSAKDDALLSEMKDIYGRYALAEDNQLLQIADAFDEFWNKYKNDMRVRPVIDSYIKESLCMPLEQTPGRKYNGIIRPEYTPVAIDSLKSDEIFVFGSNLAGAHGGGAARLAYNRFGAVWGEGVGLHGQTYAIPTMQGGVDTIKPYVDAFIRFAKEHSRLTFLVTRIGCGIAGFRDEEIAPLFTDAIDVENIILPKEFVENISLDGDRCYNLERFLTAHQYNYENALREITDGRKRTHWIWFIFPQLAVLGRSANAKYYGISGYDEAEAYLEHPILGARLREITMALLQHRGESAVDIFGDIDAVKVRSCMTLFDAVSPDDIFQEVLDAFYGGTYDKMTLDFM